MAEVELTKNPGMKRADTNSPRNRAGFFSRILLCIRRLAALTRSPVPIRWEWMAEDQAKCKSKNLGGWMLDVVGGWRFGVGRLNCSRHARAARFPFAGPSSCLPGRRPNVKTKGAARF